jgi:hypothetical protein
MKKLIRKILREEIEKSDKHYKMLDNISDHVQLPYFDSMVGLTIDDKDDQLYIMKKIFGNDITIDYQNGMSIYWSLGGHRWGKWVYIEDYTGYWEKNEYDDKGNRIYSEDSDGNWEKYEYDGRGNKIYYEHSNGDWWKREYNNDGNIIYYEDSDGRITDRR